MKQSLFTIQLRKKQQLISQFVTKNGFSCILLQPGSLIHYIMNPPSQNQDSGDSTFRSVPKIFVDEALKKGPAYYEYESQQQFDKIIWCDPSIYTCVQKLGRGKYSQVFSAYNTNNGKECVVKMLKPVAHKKILREIKILMALAGHENIIELVDLVRENQVYCLVFEKANSIDTKALLRNCSIEEGKDYMYQILTALQYSHSMGIIHRDVKPGNIIVDLDNRKVKLIDWGLGQFYLPDRTYNVHVASRYYKGPQLLVDYEYYHYSLDVWSFAALFASWIYKVEPMFKGADNVDQLVKIAQVLGSADLWAYIKKYNMIVFEEVENCIGNYPKIPLSDLVNETNRDRATPQAIDLLEKILVYDHDSRLTVEECMNHPYFASIHKTQSANEAQAIN